MRPITMGTLAPRTAPAIKPVRARGEWNFTGEPGDTPDPGEYRGGSLKRS